MNSLTSVAKILVFEKQVEILELAFDKAYANGFRGWNIWSACHKSEIKERPLRFSVNHSDYFENLSDTFKDYVVFCALDKEHMRMYKQIIFDHDFAKAFFGKRWKTCLKEMVVADDPILYLKANLKNKIS